MVSTASVIGTSARPERIVATAWVTSHNPALRILPIILGIFGYTYGSLLGVFMVGLFTRSRGNDTGNALAMLAGFIVVAYLSGLDIDVIKLFNSASTWKHVEWMPVIEFPWRIAFGTVVTFTVAMCFRTSAAQVEHMRADLAGRD